MVNQSSNNSYTSGDAELAHIAVEHLSLTIGAKATNAILRDISFTVECGSLTGIVGPNGAGKSSLLRAIYCHRYDQPASLSGQVMIAGHPVHKMNRRERACKIAVVLQESDAVGLSHRFGVLFTDLDGRARVGHVEEGERAVEGLMRPGHEQVAIIHHHEVVVILVLFGAIEEGAVLVDLLIGERDLWEARATVRPCSRQWVKKRLLCLLHVHSRVEISGCIW